MIQKVLPGVTVPIKIWTQDIEPEAEQQLVELSKMPFLFKHLAVMPDCHSGRGSTIGTVIATNNAIIPSSLGVDVGCGMGAIQLNCKISDLGDLAKLRHSLERSIPVGFHMNREESESAKAWEGWQEFPKCITKVHALEKRARLQLGSLGGGNHFIEVCKDTEDNAWVMLHSGSRNIGLSIANVYIKKAQELAEKYFIPLLRLNLLT